ncbi:MAG TPA: hypothetical protein VFZ96_01690 [Actinomycetota bacterium]|nr:hypothetical protein [Actinomycetota bacterium]
MTVAPCESFGRWHRWRTLEVVADRRDARTGHAIRMMRCERCGTLSWRWAPVPDRSSAVHEQEAPPAAPASRAAAPVPRTVTG